MQSGISIEVRKPDNDKPQDSEGNQGLEACAKQIISAVHSGDSKALAQSLKDAFEICGSYSDEYPDEQDSE